MYEHDKRVVMTLDAGGTNFVFSAIQGLQEIIEPICLPSVTDDLDACLHTLVNGFTQVKEALGCNPVAISFAFPGPADYEHGIIGDLPNFPCFRGGVALGPYLEHLFQIPVFINNDGNLFAYGEALAGILPAVNARLEQAGSCRRFRNLIGVTLGTGFGAGVVINDKLLTGDNGSGGDLWIMRSKRYPQLIADECVSIRAIRRVYAEQSGEDASTLSPKDIFDIAEGTKQGNQQAARASFHELGEMTGDALVRALNLIDGFVVIGGGVSGAAKYILPGILDELRSEIGKLDGERFPCVQMEVFDLTDAEQHKAFLFEEERHVLIPGTTQKVRYDCCKKTGIALSEMGASKAISLGAYTFALTQIDNIQP